MADPIAKTPGKSKRAKATPRKTPRNRKPQEMTLEEWQVALRREFGRGQDFKHENIGTEPIFSEFRVTNPASGNAYRVAIRGDEQGVNYCSCPDFAVNTLGTCKHIEWLLAKLQRKRGAKKAFREGFHPAYSSVYLQHGLERHVRFRRGSGCPIGLQQEVGKFFDEFGSLRPEAAASFERFARKAGESKHEVRIYEDALEHVARLRDDAARRAAVEKRYGGDRAEKALANRMKVSLYPYQREGAVFAAKAGRCLIADDMGLGKTIQAIAACEILADVAGVERVLVVCPTALKHQWKQEVARFTGRDAVVIEGLRHVRRDLYAGEDAYKITNYETIHRDLELINGWQPDVVVLDEAQRIKNWQARRAKAVKQIASDHAIVLTGTPLENRLEELHSIMEFVDRFHLGPLFRFLDQHQHTEETGRVVGYRNLDKIKENLAHVLIRRRKQEVLKELPDRTDKHFLVDMTQQQRAIHEENREIVAKLVNKWKRHGFLTEADQRRLMVAMQHMRMACNSTFLVDKATDSSTKIDECATLLDEVLETPENKVVVFSQWLGTHELLIRRLEPMKHGYAFYHGSLDARKRKRVLEDFRKDPDCRVLLCTDSGGVGLNLQFASVLVNMDQPWNPAVLEQRIGRVHRLGQHRSVQVYHFVSRGTIEEGMLNVLRFKTSMFEGVLDGGESEVFLGKTKMKKFMETVENVSGAIETPAPTEEAEPPAAEPAKEAAEPKPAKESAAPEPVWGDLIAAGVAFVAKLGEAAQSGGGADGFSLDSLVRRNEQTGAHEIRVPLPDAETARQLGGLLSGLGEALKSMGGK